MLRQILSLTHSVATRAKVRVPKRLSASKNGGKSAVKNIHALGFETATTKPCRKIFSLRFCFCSLKFPRAKKVATPR